MDAHKFKFTQNFIEISPADSLKQLKVKAANVAPTKRQLDWQQLELTAMLHFGINTFTDREWGDGKEDINAFCPSDYDAGQWIRILSESGFRGVILTAKHHDGFCLWPSAYTEYCVKNTEWKDGKADIVRDVADACRQYGVKFGVYLSPWDRHDSRYGDSPRYNEYFISQLTELLTNYGDVYEVWFDGACAEGPNGKKQEYDWHRYFSLIRKLQNDAVISIVGPDVRWVGNEAGKGRESEWSAIPYSRLVYKDGEQEAFIHGGEDLCMPDLGGDASLESAKKEYECIFWYPAQVDTSIRPGWFYHPWEDGKVKSLDRLMQIYYSSVGSNAQLLLNVPPDTRGRISDPDIERLRELSAYLQTAFSNNLAEHAKISRFMLDGCPVTDITLDAVCTVNHITIMEDIAKGQHIAGFSVQAWLDGVYTEIGRGSTIGYKTIRPLTAVTAQKFRVVATDYRAEPLYAFIGLYNAPAIHSPPVISRNDKGMVSISGSEGAEISYSIDGGVSSPYTGPFELTAGGEVGAVSEISGNHLFGEKTVMAKQRFGLLKNGWSILSVSGECAPGYAVQNLLNDDGPHVLVNGNAPISVVYDMGTAVEATGFLYLPVSDVFDFSANLLEYEWHVSDDGLNWIRVCKGTFSNLRNNPIQQEVRFEAPVTSRYAKFTAIRGFDSERVAFGKISITAPVGRG